MNVKPIIKRIAFKLLVGVVLTTVLLVGYVIMNIVPELKVWQSNFELSSYLLVLFYFTWAFGLIRFSEPVENEGECEMKIDMTKAPPPAQRKETRGHRVIVRRHR